MQPATFIHRSKKQWKCEAKTELRRNNSKSDVSKLVVSSYKFIVGKHRELQLESHAVSLPILPIEFVWTRYRNQKVQSQREVPHHAPYFLLLFNGGLLRH